MLFRYSIIAAACPSERTSFHLEGRLPGCCQHRVHRAIIISVVPCVLMALMRSEDRLYSSQGTLERLCSFVALFYQFVRKCRIFFLCPR